ncbi:hypothetical protein CFP65_7498 [Kitasatospora sp. MMS16-BH015]|uniref:DUF4129 domain-containing protein n=1 Tax=Kitasatospora sp. MMS16-BH015 TaxID=2018025 RepID=UPI000CA2E807|nr:DUF4129 domain-containing protein [Kitasatospora sp. MMS16-BH015]AUG82076.1 hypothetical protein CFP65_7498 [Kitasatospora sp. MMS16-BH015]
MDPRNSGGQDRRPPGRRHWHRPLSAALAVGALALAALALRPADGPPAWHAGGPLGEQGGLTALLALGAALGGAVLITRHRARRRDEPGTHPAVERLVTAVGVLLPMATVLLPLTLLLLPGRPHPLREPAPEPSPSDPLPPPSGPPTTPPPPTHPPAPTETHHSAGPLLGIIALTLVAIAAVVGLVLLYRHYGHLLRRRAATAPGLFDSPPEEPDQALAEAVDSGRRALHGEDVRTAVIACYAAMELSLADSGVPGRASDSPSDLLARAAADGRLAGEAPQALAELFREARYSTHPMTPHHLDRARAALDTIAAQLAAAAAEAPEEVASR